MFDSDSRYFEVEDFEVPDGRGGTVKVKKLRLTRQPHTPAARRVVEQDRPDLLAHEYFRNATQFWKIADANILKDPWDLVSKPGRMIKLPERT